ncbi:MAG: translation initiation factor IF-2 [Planctomycetota bacterium]|jgi:translation initiation factor IF-2
MKVFELAKELGMTGTRLVERCKSVGIIFKNNQASVDPKQARMIRAMFPPPSPEELARRAAAERALKAKAKPKAKKKKKAKKVAKKVVKKKKKKKVKKKGAKAPAAAPEDVDAETAEALPAAKAKKKKAAKKKAKSPEEPEPLIKFQVVGEADAAAPVATEEDLEGGEAEALEAATKASAAAALREEIPKTRIDALLADRRWEKLGIVSRARSARAQAQSRIGGRGRRRSRRRVRTRSGRATSHKVAERPRGEVAIALPITVRKLSAKIGVRSNILISKLLQQGTPVGINDVLPEETAQLLALEYDVDLKVRRERDLEEELEGLLKQETAEGELVPKAPVITFLGHVDHGKTSLLDHIRRTFLCFIDTPGHEAFTEMRARGAHVTDIAVLVVAADDGVMPQTEEAISHARAAGVPIVVALNKMDLPSADAMRAKQQLAALELNPEEWGGGTGVVECSAETGQGMDHLLERIALEAEMLEFKAAPGKAAQGFVLDAKVTEGRGIVATVLVRDGTLNKGDVILSSHGFGRVKGLFDHMARALEEAGPSVPVEVTGLSEIPEAGDRFYVLDDLDQAREIASNRAQAAREAARTAPRHVTLETLGQFLSAGEEVELKVVLKADVKGTLEAIVPPLEGIGAEDASVNMIHQGVGAVNASDVLLADASGGICVGFNVGADASARTLAQERGVDIRLHTIIYELVDEVKKGLEGKLAPEEREVVTGHAEVRQAFRLTRAGTVAGSYILDGVVERSSRVRVTRDGTVVFDGTLAGLRRFKDEVREVREGFECGIKIEGLDEVHVGDQIEAYHIEEVARTLD